MSKQPSSSESYLTATPGTAASPPWGVCVLLVAGTVLADVVSERINMAILYSLPLVLCARAAGRRVLFTWAAALVALTYLDYAVKLVLSDPRQALDYRLVNRTLVAVSLAITAFLLHFLRSIEHKLASRQARQGAHDADDAIYLQIVHALERFVTCVISAVLILCIAVTDVLAPAQVNLPVLYAVPLVLCFWTRSRKLLWGMLPILLVFTVAGYYAGSPTSVDQRWLASLQTNRFLAAGGLLGLTVIFHFWIGSSRPHGPVMLDDPILA